MFSFFSFFSRENAFDNGALVGPVCVYIYIYIYIYHNINTRENIPAITPFLPRVSLCLFRPSEWRSLCCRIRWKMQITFQSSSLLCSLWLFGTCAGYPLSLELSFLWGEVNRENACSVSPPAKLCTHVAQTRPRCCATSHFQEASEARCTSPRVYLVSPGFYFIWFHFIARENKRGNSRRKCGDSRVTRGVAQWAIFKLSPICPHLN